MIPPPIPENDRERVESLRRMMIVSTPDEHEFDRITRMAQRIFRVPIVLISLVDDERQWIKSCVGLDVRETSRQVSFCGHAIAAPDDLLIVEDATKDERFIGNPLVTGSPQIRFYAGRPLKNQEGFAIGTLCLIDTQPRKLLPEDRQSLDDLGSWAEIALVVRVVGEAQRTLLSELETAHRETLIDPQLRIWNRAGILEMLAREIKRTAEKNAWLSVLLIDVDQLKSIGDRYGQSVRDEVHEAISVAIRRRLRPWDTLGRYGGDQFLVVTPTGEGDAAAIAERIARGVEGMVLQGEGGSVARELACTVTIGRASLEPTSIGSSAALIEAAEQSLVLAKERSSVRTRQAEGSSPIRRISGLFGLKLP